MQRHTKQVTLLSIVNVKNVQFSLGLICRFGSVRYNVSRKVDGIVGSIEGRKVIAEFLVVFVRSYRLTRSKVRREQKRENERARQRRPG